ncbi:hypothetical protein [Actinokineospora bangkokensis]|uniref:Nucleotidyltransferase-like protein n=1 Tax=Actinokineospora bangkokensis TaxID=1193682 RepID=A0A1Q9LTX5_9PSEU|nr:hypothetical protein [Actinokineospora bangkokensis]OLR95478.1 hypothetical protein BJP25_07005 [Actinokineospora bangkokensis]
MSKAPPGADRDELTTAARGVLLDALWALEPHLDRLTVVGGQAVHLRTSPAPLRSAAYTSDGDLHLDPRGIAEQPRIEEALRAAGFARKHADLPGLWQRTVAVGGVPTKVAVDLLTGFTLVRGGRRSADIEPHDRMAVNRVRGLETAAVDRSAMVIGSLDPRDDRAVTVHVAGEVALLVAKAHKIGDRLEQRAARPDRLVDKDAGDVYRIMVTADAGAVAAAFTALLAHPVVGEVTGIGLRLLRRQFGARDTEGVRMAVAALAGDVPETRVRVVMPAFVARLPRV